MMTLCLPKRFLWFATFSIGLVALLGLLMFNPDLRGWSPASGRLSNAIIQPTRSSQAAFRIADCLPGSVKPHDLPRTEEYAGSASLSILSCRSRSSAWKAILAYLAIAASSFAVRVTVVRRHRRRNSASVEPDGNG